LRTQGGGDAARHEPLDPAVSDEEAWDFAAGNVTATALGSSSASVDVERELEGRMLLTEQRRSAVLACILAAIVVGRTVYQYIYGLAEDALLGRGYMLLLMAAWVGVETHTFIWVSRRMREGREWARSRAYFR